MQSWKSLMVKAFGALTCPVTGVDPARVVAAKGKLYSRKGGGG